MYLRNIEVTNMKLVWYLKIFCGTFYKMLKDADLITHFGLIVVCILTVQKGRAFLFPCQQWLYESTTVFCDIYVACLVCSDKCYNSLHFQTSEIKNNMCVFQNNFAV